VFLHYHHGSALPGGVGLNRAHKVTKNEIKQRHSSCHGTSPSTPGFVGTMIQEWCSFTQYTGHTISLHKDSKDKRTISFIRKRVGTHIHAKGKEKELSSVLAAMRNVAAKKVCAP
uniref:Large ribosomal subunit protein eL36 n=1 Tax=Castor canadensis TaxID=51338 RepID=A0A8C0WPN1_CASCN